MRFGVNLHNYGPLGKASAISTIAKRAEQLGYHSAWTTGHILVPQETGDPYGHLLETLTTLSYLAASLARSTWALRSSSFVRATRSSWPSRPPPSASSAADASRSGSASGGSNASSNTSARTSRGAAPSPDEYLEAIKTLWAADGPISFHGTSVDFSGALLTRPRPGKQT